MLNFQEMIARLTQFWAEQGCVVHQGYDLEVGAGTFNPATFLRCLGPEPYSAVYVEPSRRPKDGRYGDNPNRVQFYHQMQVIIKPSPANIQELYLQSLAAIGLNLDAHDIRFVHDDWENPTIGAWGLGWEVWIDGMEATQFTYFQAIGGIPVSSVSGEITYGLERLAMYLQGVNSMFELKWNDHVTYGDIFKRNEYEWSHYNFTKSNAKMWQRHFEDFEEEAKRLISENLPIPAYDFVMKASHAFNMLDARGVISVSERTGYMARIRNLAKMLAENYLASRESQGFPLSRLKKEAKEPLHCPPPSEKHDPLETQDFLLEIGSEELPATFVPIGMRGLEHQISALLNANGLNHGAIHTYGTPRRLAIHIENLVGGTATQSLEKKGPPLSSAFDSEGKPTAAALGFFRSVDVNPITLAELHAGKTAGIEIRELKNIPYLFACFDKKGVATRALLAEMLPKIILGLDFPKKMRWSDLNIEYARPLRWIVALYADEVIPFAVGDILSGSTSFGHRSLSSGPINIHHPRAYLDLLREAWVMADVVERKASIEQQLSEAELSHDGLVVSKERVMPQVLHLVEWPFLATAEFDKRFLKAPKEVLISEMVEHQKYFPVQDTEGNLHPLFAIVCNRPATDLIRLGNQRALSPRLADGMFLYEEDLKVPLDTHNEMLKNMTFLKDLGTMYQKEQRLVEYVKLLHRHLPIANLEQTIRAASICKADLASALVGEFPELQGFIGKLYAQKQGEHESVATAIDEHWMPRGEKAPLPKTPGGILVSIADKIDNLICSYAVGLKPTSSSDPYALRRQAMGILKMLIEGKYSLSLEAIFSQALHQCSLRKETENLQFSPSLIEEILGFMTNRFRTIVIEYGFEKDECEAVVAQGLDNPYLAFCKIQALNQFRKNNHPAFLDLCNMHTRVKKILLSQNPKLTPLWKEASLSDRFPPIDSTLLQDQSEKAYFEKMRAVEMALPPLVKDHQWQEAFTLVAELQDPLSQLFEKVKILDDHPVIQKNRLSLLQGTWDLCEGLVDLGKIQEHAQK